MQHRIVKNQAMYATRSLHVVIMCTQPCTGSQRSHNIHSCLLSEPECKLGGIASAGMKGTRAHAPTRSLCWAIAPSGCRERWTAAAYRGARHDIHDHSHQSLAMLNNCAIPWVVMGITQTLFANDIECYAAVSYACTLLPLLQRQRWCSSWNRSLRRL